MTQKDLKAILIEAYCGYCAHRLSGDCSVVLGDYACPYHLDYHGPDKELRARAILWKFISSRIMGGWEKGACDLWLGPLWHEALDFLKDEEA